MDSLITAAARALAAGDPLGALNRVALRDDAPALALRGIAMAQLGDLDKARLLLRRAARAFGPRETLARARCVVAEAEIALAARELGHDPHGLIAAREVLEQHGDRANAVQARHVEIRRMLLTGQLDEAARALQAIGTRGLPPALLAVQELLTAGIAIRRLQARSAASALERAARAAAAAGIASLQAEVASATQLLHGTAARLMDGDQARALRLAEVETLRASPALIVDACRHVVHDARSSIRLARRPVLFRLAYALGTAWPGDIARDTLIWHAFGAKRANESHRARLRVEIGRLRALLRPLAGIHATPAGFALTPTRAPKLVVLARPVDEPHAALLACLADGEAWSSSALAIALGTSQRSVQRALDALAAQHKLQSFGKGRARRWSMPPLPGLTTTLLLPSALPGQ